MSRHAVRNAAAYYTNTLVSAVLGVVINPLLLTALGPLGFGLWKSTQRLMDLSGAANGGVMQALKWVIAYRSSDSDMEAKRRYIGAAVIALGLWTPVLLGAAAIMVLLLPTLLEGVPEDQTPVVIATGVLLTLNIIISSWAALSDATLIGTNQGYRSMIVTTLVLVGSNVAMVVAAMSGLYTPGLAACLLLGTAVNGVVTFGVARRRIPWFGYHRPRKQEILELSKFSGWVLVWGITDKVLLASEVILMSTLAGVVVVSSFTFTGYVAQFALAFCLLTTSALMPTLGAELGRGVDTTEITRRSRELTMAVAFLFACSIALLNGPFVTLWAGGAQYLGHSVNAMLALAFLQLALIRLDSQVQDTRMRIASKAMWGVGIAVGGLIGGAIGYLTTLSLEFLFIGMIIGRLAGNIVFPLLANRAVEVNEWPWRSLLIGLPLFVACAVAAPYLPNDSWWWLMGCAIVSVPVLTIVLYFGALSPSTRMKLRRQ